MSACWTIDRNSLWVRWKVVGVQENVPLTLWRRQSLTIIRTHARYLCLILFYIYPFSSLSELAFGVKLPRITVRIYLYLLFFQKWVGTYIGTCVIVEIFTTILSLIGHEDSLWSVNSLWKPIRCCWLSYLPFESTGTGQYLFGENVYLITVIEIVLFDDTFPLHRPSCLGWVHIAATWST